jgi:hypothetical protein
LLPIQFKQIFIINGFETSMDLKQLQVAYQQNEDRLLLRASFKTDGDSSQEVRAWLTRRLVRNLWPGIVKALETQVTLDQPQATHAKAEIAGMAYQDSIEKINARGDFNKKFEADAQAYPIGDIPILVAAAHFAITANKPVRINFTSAQGKGFEIAFTATILHGFCTLLQNAVKTAAWDIDLRLPGAASADARPAVLN